MGESSLIFIFDIFMTFICIYIATKFAFVQADLKSILMIVFIVSVVSLIPTVGWILGLCTFVYLLMKVTDANLIDSIWVVILSKLTSFFIILLVRSIGS